MRVMSTLAHMRENWTARRALVFAAIAASGTWISQPQLIAITGLKQPRVSESTSFLVEFGYVEKRKMDGSQAMENRLTPSGYNLALNIKNLLD